MATLKSEASRNTATGFQGEMLPAQLRGVPMIENNKDFILINESFPHIGKKLHFLWGHPEFAALMDDLQLNKRGVQRQGFPFDIALALNNLDSEHSFAFPELTEKEDIWSLSHGFSR